MAFKPVLVEDDIVWDKIKILAIDDNYEILELMQAWLRSVGFDIVLAESAEAGLPHIASGGVDVLLTDILMPEMDGIELIKRLRLKHPKLWIVAISGGSKFLPADAALNLSRALGANRVLNKPFCKDELLAAVSRKESPGVQGNR